MIVVTLPELLSSVAGVAALGPVRPRGLVFVFSRPSQMTSEKSTVSGGLSNVA
jgi:hypothetical protein